MFVKWNNLTLRGVTLRLLAASYEYKINQINRNHEKPKINRTRLSPFINMWCR